MAELNVTNCLITPTENDVYGAGSVGDGRILQELYLQKQWRYAMGCPGGVISGFLVPTSDADLTASITAGSAIVAGYYVVTATAIAHTYTASKDTHMWLALPVDGNDKVTAARIYYAEVSVGAARPASPTTGYAGAIYLGYVTTDADNITGGADHRPQGRRSWGSVSATHTIADAGTCDWTVASGATGVSTITFDTAFLRSPILVITCENGYFAGIVSRTTTTAEIRTIDDAGSAADKAYHFEAIL